jgi:hypothetical protein
MIKIAGVSAPTLERGNFDRFCEVPPLRSRNHKLGWWSIVLPQAPASDAQLCSIVTLRWMVAAIGAMVSRQAAKVRCRSAYLAMPGTPVIAGMTSLYRISLPLPACQIAVRSEALSGAGGPDGPGGGEHAAQLDHLCTNDLGERTARTIDTCLTISRVNICSLS